VDQGKIAEEAEGDEQKDVLEDVGEADIAGYASQRPPIDARDSQDKGIPMEPEGKGGAVNDEEGKERP
jgi:hypothetical protein